MRLVGIGVRQGTNHAWMGCVRDALDRYYTPPGVARACVDALELESAPQRTLEPSIGCGAFARAALERWPDTELWGVDLDPAAAGLQLPDRRRRIVGDWPSVASSFSSHKQACPDLVIGNPPYRDAESHVRAAIGTGAQAVAFLLRLGFLAGRARGAGLWAEHPPAEVHVLVGRPSFSANGRTDSQEYALFVWRSAWLPFARQPPIIRWLYWSKRPSALAVD